MGHYKFAIGCDEFNKGFHLKDFPHLLVVGVLGKDGREYGTPKYGGKSNRRFFSNKRKPCMEKVLECSRYFLSENPKFLYVSIPKKEIQTKTQYDLAKSKAVSMIALSFLKEQNLPPEQTALYIDQMDGTKDLNFVDDTLSLWLKSSGEDFAKIRFIPHGERTKKVIKKADMIGYYLAALKREGCQDCWPYRNKKLDVKSLETLFS